MQFLSKLIEICRQHYEKVLLSFALLALAGAVIGIYYARINEQRKIEAYLQGLDRRVTTPLKPIDLGRFEAILQQASHPPALNLGTPHNVLNPVKWVKQPDGQLIKSVKGTEATLDLLQLTNLHPLLLAIAYERPMGSGYSITTTNEMARGAGYRTVYSYQLNETNRPVLIVREVQGPKEDPAELMVELKDSGERVSLARNKPFLRTNAFEVDLKYANKVFTRQRAGAALNLGGEDYKIVAITASEVVFSAANDKKYAVRLNAQR